MVDTDGAGGVRVSLLPQPSAPRSAPAQPPVLTSPAPLQANTWKKKQTSDPNRTLVLGGVIAISLVALVVVALGGMYLLQRLGSDQETTAKRVVGQADQAPVAPATVSRSGNRPTGSNSNSQSGSRVTSNSNSMQLVDLIEIVEPSVVRLDVKSDEGDSIGSGVFVSDSGLIVTNFHVVQGAYKITVTTRDGRSAVATGFYQADPMKDLATIQVDPSKLDVVAIPLADVLPRKGADVAAFGSPMGFSFSATEGVVSSIRSGKEVQDALKMLVGIDVYSLLGYSVKTNWIQMTAAISGGNSGGPLVNMAGELIGINTWTNPEGQNLNFASTVDEIKLVLKATRQSSLRDFSALPKRRIEIQFKDPGGQARPGQRRPGEIVSNDRRRPGGSRRGSISGQPGSRPYSTKDPDSGSSAFSPKVLTPEEIAANDAERERRRAASEKRVTESRAKMFGLEEIVLAEEGESFSTDSAPGVSRSFDTQSGVILDVTLSADERYLATTSSDGTVCVFNFRSGKLLYRIKTQYKQIRETAFASSPIELYTIRDKAPRSDSICYRDPETGKPNREGIKNSGSEVASLLAVSPNGRSVVGNWGDSTMAAFLWRYGALDGKVTPTHLSDVFNQGLRRVALAAQFTQDDKVLITGFNDGWISASTGAGRSFATKGAREVHSGGVTELALSNDGSKVVSGGEDNQLNLTTMSGKSWRTNRLGSTDLEIYGVAFSKDGRLVAATRENQTIEIYSVDTRQLVATLTADSICSEICFFGSDRFIVAGGQDGVIRIFNVPQ